MQPTLHVSMSRRKAFSAEEVFSMLGDHLPFQMTELTVVHSGTNTMSMMLVKWKWHGSERRSVRQFPSSPQVSGFGSLAVLVPSFKVSFGDLPRTRRRLLRRLLQHPQPHGHEAQDGCSLQEKCNETKARHNRFQGSTLLALCDVPKVPTFTLSESGQDIDITTIPGPRSDIKQSYCQVASGSTR